MQQAAQRLRANEKRRLTAAHKELLYDPTGTFAAFEPDPERAKLILDAGIEFASGQFDPFPSPTLSEDVHRALRQLKLEGGRPETCFGRSLFYLGASSAVLFCDKELPRETVTTAYEWATLIQHALIETFLATDRGTRERLWGIGPVIGINREYLRLVFAGAWGASAVAYRLLERRMRVFLPDPNEDARWKIDLIAVHPGSVEGYCLQLETGSDTACRLLRTSEEPRSGYEAAFRRGVRRFNGLYRTRYLPVAVSVKISGHEQQDIRRFPDLDHALQLGFPRKLGPLEES